MDQHPFALLLQPLQHLYSLNHASRSLYYQFVIDQTVEELLDCYLLEHELFREVFYHVDDLHKQF